MLLGRGTGVLQVKTERRKTGRPGDRQFVSFIAVSVPRYVRLTHVASPSRGGVIERDICIDVSSKIRNARCAFGEIMDN